MGETALNDVFRHGSSAALGVDGDDLDGIALINIEEWLDDFHFLLHSFPVEEMLELLGGKMDEYAIIGLYGSPDKPGGLSI